MPKKKEIAIDFLHLTSKGRSREAFSKYGGENFKHHNVFFKGDAESLIIAMEEAAKANPEISVEVQRALEDGSLVAVHSRIRLHSGDNGTSAMHIFKFDEDKIIELWDFGQEVPTEILNENGMF